MSVSWNDEEKNNNQTNIKDTNLPAYSIINNGKNAPEIDVSKQEDHGFSAGVRRKSSDDMGDEITTDGFIYGSDTYSSIMHGANWYSSAEIKSHLYNQVFRYGIANPYTTLGSAREFLFFTKPDLHILHVTGENSTKPGIDLNPALESSPFWKDLYGTRKDTTIRMLQGSIDDVSPFNYLLQNQCKSNLDIPGLSSEMIDTPVNNYGVGYSYRGSSEASDDNPEFSLEFKDNRYLDTYYFFRAYDEYEQMKHHGAVAPPDFYIINKILHDCFSIYKFIVLDDMETIVYWGKMYGVVPKSLPRDVFSDPNFDNGLSYSIDFKAAFYEDMKPEILSDFNYLGQNLWDKQKYNIGTYNSVLGRPDTRPAEAAHVVIDTKSAIALASPTGYVYKLKWKGSTTR